MSRGILDTSTLILLGRLQETDPLPDEPVITAITLAELSVGPLVASTEEERAARFEPICIRGHEFREQRILGTDPGKLVSAVRAGVQMPGNLGIRRIAGGEPLQLASRGTRWAGRHHVSPSKARSRRSTISRSLPAIRLLAR